MTYSFDADGNTTGRSDGAVLTYTHENRLATYTQGATTADYAYDPLGRRIRKTVNGVTTWYLWDGTQLLGEYDGSGNRTKRYAYLPGGYAPAQVADANGTYNVHSDHLDMPKLMTDSAQQVVWRGRQAAFGTTLVDAGSTVEMNVRFPGQYYDQETGLHYNYFRYYDPQTGRYITSDPIGLNGGLNTYGYVLGNPISNYDQLGLECASFRGFMYCGYPEYGGPEFRVPSPSGVPGEIGADSFENFLLYHKYDVEVPLDGADAECVMNKLVESPTPGTPNPATLGGTRNNARVIPGLSNWVTSYLASDKNTGSPIVVNVADSGSAFPPGYVARTVSNGKVHTYGEGLNWLQAIPGPQAVGNWYYWERQMRQIVSECSCMK